MNIIIPILEIVGMAVLFMILTTKLSRRIDYYEQISILRGTPSWISKTSTIISILVFLYHLLFLLGIFVILYKKNEENISAIMILGLTVLYVISIICKFISYGTLLGIYKIYLIIRKYIYNSGPK